MSGFFLPVAYRIAPAASGKAVLALPEGKASMICYGV
jgi:hypothetical protein